MTTLKDGFIEGKDLLLKSLWVKEHNPGKAAENRLDARGLAHLPLCSNVVEASKLILY
jgi:hypothetical protein